MTRAAEHALIVLCLLVCAASAAAQSAPDGGPDTSKVRVHFGPLWMNPVLSVSNIGVDRNVFNEPTNPKRDFTVTITPNTDLWLRLGPTWLVGTMKEEVVWYQKYASERSSNTGYTLGWKLPLARLTFALNGDYLSSRERPGFEIDLRAHRKQLSYNGSVEARLLGSLFVGIRAGRQKITFDEDTVFQGSDLHDELNRTMTTTGLSLRSQVTPLTSVALNATKSQDRFAFNPLRDSDSTQVSVNVLLAPFAIVKGNVTIGFRDFVPLSPNVPSFTGMTLGADASYSIFGTTRFTANAIRDVSYSYDINQPYYVLTGFSGTVAQQLFGPLDIVVRFGREQMAYRDRAGGTIQFSERTDHVRSYGGGLGFHMGKDLRLGLNIDKEVRTSVLDARKYENLKVGTSVTYGGVSVR